MLFKLLYFEHSDDCHLQDIAPPLDPGETQRDSSRRLLDVQRGLQVAVVVEADLGQRSVAERLRELCHLALDGSVVEGEGEVDGHPDEEGVEDDERVVVHRGGGVAFALLNINELHYKLFQLMEFVCVRNVYMLSLFLIGIYY